MPVSRQRIKQTSCPEGTCGGRRDRLSRGRDEYDPPVTATSKASRRFMQRELERVRNVGWHRLRERAGQGV